MATRSPPPRTRWSRGIPSGPDILIPNHQLGHIGKVSPIEPEKKLLLALLEDGLMCYQRYLWATSKTGRAFFQEAQEWIWKNNGRNLFSFLNICEMVGLDPQRVRTDLIQWKMRALKRHPPREVPLPMPPTKPRAQLSQYP